VKFAVFAVVSQLTLLEIVPVIVPPEIVPVFVMVPEFVMDPADVNVTPDGIASVSPLSPSVTVPQFVVGVILLTLTSLIIFPYKLFFYWYLYLIITIPDPPAAEPFVPCAVPPPPPPPVLAVPADP